MANKNSKSTLPILAVLLFLLLAACGYLIYSNVQLKNQKEKVTSELDKVNEINNDLEVSFSNATDQLEGLKSDNVALNSIIEEQKVELEKKRDRINQLIYVERNYNQAQKEIESLKALSDKYVTEIQNLKDKNLQLTSENESLIQETAELSDSLSLTSQEKEKLEELRIKLEEERDELGAKVDVASAIRVNNVTATGYKIRNSGKLVDKSNADKVEQVSVCFTTEENPIAEEGEEVFYVRIINPLGETLAIEDLGSGTLVKSTDQSPLKYTMSGNLMYDRSEKQACLEWKPGLEFMKGIYKIEVYNKGFLTGTTEMRLK